MTLPTAPRRLAESTFARFLVVGGVSYLVNQAALYLLFEGLMRHWGRWRSPIGPFDLGLLAASVLAVELSIAVRFVLNDRWTFRDRCAKPLAARLWQFNLTSCASPLLSLACVNLLTPRLGVSYLLANSLGIALGLAWNWAWSDSLVWQRRDAAASAGASSV